MCVAGYCVNFSFKVQASIVLNVQGKFDIFSARVWRVNGMYFLLQLTSRLYLVKFAVTNRLEFTTVSSHAKDARCVNILHLYSVSISIL